jgi:hypothetical protein
MDAAKEKNSTGMKVDNAQGKEVNQMNLRKEKK